MYTILGIDAAWTAGQPRGVALVEGAPKKGWRCLCVAPSYNTFIAACRGGNVPWSKAKHPGSKPDILALLAAAVNLTGWRSVNLAAIDMPLSYELITTRREADNAISRAFSSRGCGTHSPTPQSPVGWERI